jgi:mRNA interferase RelE/StbE
VTYRVELTASAARELLRVHPDARPRLQTHIEALAGDPRPRRARPLKGEFKGLWRLRVGDYRIIYEISDQAHLVTVAAIGPRGAVYK